MIYVYRVTAGQEKVVLDMLMKKIKKETLKVYSIAHFEDLKGYLIVEGEDEVSVRQAGLRIPHIKGVLDRPMAIKDIEGMIEAAKPAVLSVNKGDLVELISGPFKGEKARVIKIDTNKDEVTVELSEVAVPIPVTIKANTIKVFQKASEQN
ncbi:TPA: transcription elongation factor Spt5 [Candidatus Micrarchaeota archaeon]|nr:transcription elongation factor Spt5 [Candidatus Micrarchaeota archaeon]HIH30788.1 transcription elongation factor Spt5 [Candidatus Micrarchaeota archaeon]